MHEKIKDFLDKTGSAHHRMSDMEEHKGMAHEEMHHIEREHYSGKMHHRHEEI